MPVGKLRPSSVYGIYEEYSAPVEQPTQYSNGAILGAVPLALRKKLQVFEKDERFFALDQNALKYYQNLELNGNCSEVEIEIVARKNIPDYLWKLAFCLDDEEHWTEDTEYYEEEEEEPIPDMETMSNRSSTPPTYATKECEDLAAENEFTCFVCFEQFACIRHQMEHQLILKHYGCSTCGAVYNTMKKLQEHEGQAEHGWDDDSV